MKSTELLQISSLEKVLMSKRPDCKEISYLSALKNERVSYQIAYYKESGYKASGKIKIESQLKEYITVRRVLNVPCATPAFSDNCDGDYLFYEPCLAPDALVPIDTNDADIFGGKWMSLWVTVDTNEKVPAGEYDISVTLEYEENKEKFSETKTLKLEIINACLPPQKLKFTQWLHCDCIASYYNIPVFSEEHWCYIEKFIKCAAQNGINMILTPVFTPPLDTAIGGERPTVQLADVKLSGGKYSFGFEKLGRWIDMCLKCGIEYFEMSHLFTQWGAAYTPKIVAEENEKEKRVFGWDVKSTSEEYKAFLTAFLPELSAYLKSKGISEKVYFHISDEPHGEEAKKNYQSAKNLVRKLLPEYKIIDALSDIEMYKENIVDIPVAATDSIKPFLKENIPERWAYYCTCQAKGVSNRFIAMPLYRTRAIAEQLFKYNISGFLHWGYNFYYSQLSKKLIDPFHTTDADGAFQSGDSFSVYPGKGGPLESIRLSAFSDAISDIRAMELLSKLKSREYVIKLFENIAGMNIEFDSYPENAGYILELRKAINYEIKELSNA